MLAKLVRWKPVACVRSKPVPIPNTATHPASKPAFTPTLDNLMDTYLNPPTYEQSLSNYQTYLKRLSTEDSFKGQFFGEKLLSVNKILSENERSYRNVLLAAMALFGGMAAFMLFDMYSTIKFNNENVNFDEYLLELIKAVAVCWQNDDNALKFVRQLPSKYTEVRHIAPLYQRVFNRCAHLILNGKGETKDGQIIVDKFIGSITAATLRVDAMTFNTFVILAYLMQNQKITLNNDNLQRLEYLLQFLLDKSRSNIEIKLLTTIIHKIIKNQQNDGLDNFVISKSFDQIDRKTNLEAFTEVINGQFSNYKNTNVSAIGKLE